MFKFSKSKLSIGKIWNDSFALYKQVLNKVWYLAFITALLPSLSSLWQQGTLATNFNLGTAIYQLAAILVVIFLGAVILHYIYSLAAKPKTKVITSLRAALTKYLIILGAALIIYLVLFVILLLILASIVGVNNLTAMPENVLLAKAAIGLAIWLVIALFVGIMCVFVAPSILFDNLGIFKAIKTSIQLVWGNWWRTFIIFLLPVLLIGIVSILLQETINNLLLSILIAALFSGLVLPYIQSMILVQFNDLKLRKK